MITERMNRKIRRRKKDALAFFWVETDRAGAPFH